MVSMPGTVIIGASYWPDIILLFKIIVFLIICIIFVCCVISWFKSKNPDTLHRGYISILNLIAILAFFWTFEITLSIYSSLQESCIYSSLRESGFSGKDASLDYSEMLTHIWPPVIFTSRLLLCAMIFNVIIFLLRQFPYRKSFTL